MTYFTPVRDKRFLSRVIVMITLALIPLMAVASPPVLLLTMIANLFAVIRYKPFK